LFFTILNEHGKIQGQVPPQGRRPEDNKGVNETRGYWKAGVIYFSYLRGHEKRLKQTHAFNATSNSPKEH
jgi:hypothetical protein